MGESDSAKPEYEVWLAKYKPKYAGNAEVFLDDNGLELLVDHQTLRTQDTRTEVYLVRDCAVMHSRHYGRKGNNDQIDGTLVISGLPENTKSLRDKIRKAIPKVVIKRDAKT